MISERELISIAGMERSQIAAAFRVRGTMRVNDALTFIANLRKALAEYKRKHPIWSEVEPALLGHLSAVEKWARDAYVQVRVPQLMRSFEKLTPSGAKQAARMEFESLLKKGYH